MEYRHIRQQPSAAVATCHAPPDAFDEPKNHNTTLGEYTSTPLLACDRDNRLP